MPFSADTSAFLNAWRRDYPPDVLPSIWTKIEEAIDQGILFASEEVLIELEQKDDEVHTWAHRHHKMFRPIDGHVQQTVRVILSRYTRLLDTRKNRSGADPFVIAQAQIENSAVVTDERSTGDLSRPNIPDVCAAMGIRCVNLIGMGRELHWRI